MIVQDLQPVLNPGVYAFTVAPDGMSLGALDIVASVREREGLSLVAEESAVLRAGLPVMFRAAWITLSATTELQATGLMARFSAVLANARIACNVFAGVHHDHIFVPIEDAQRALDVLRMRHDSG